MRSVLFYNLYPKYIWRSVTNKLLSNVPHDAIIVHVTMPIYAWIYQPYIKYYLKRFTKVEQIIFSRNIKKQGETIGFNKIRKMNPFDGYDIITYIHSKGTSKRRKNTQPIKDWTEMMRYFVVERLDLCKQAFANGYYLYGVELSNHLSEQARIEFPDVKFIFDGNFVSINNKVLKQQFLETPCRKTYYGVERFWSGLCDKEKAYCPHYSNVDHYNDPYPPSMYNTLYPISNS
jgi:hypothetical protein